MGLTSHNCSLDGMKQSHWAKQRATVWYFIDPAIRFIEELVAFNAFNRDKDGALSILVVLNWFLTNPCLWLFVVFSAVLFFITSCTKILRLVARAANRGWKKTEVVLLAAGAATEGEAASAEVVSAGAVAEPTNVEIISIVDVIELAAGERLAGILRVRGGMGAGASALTDESPDADIKAAYEGASAQERSVFLVDVGEQHKRKLVSLGLDVPEAAPSGPFADRPSHAPLSKKRASVQLSEHKALPLLVALDKPLVDALRSSAVKLIDADRIRDGTITKIMRRQDLERLERERGVRLFLSPERSIEVHGSYEREIASLTYGWDTPDGDDPTGEYLAAVRRYLLSALGEHVRGVFWDCPCLPQEPRSASEEAVFGEALGVMALTYASVLSTTVIRHTRVPARPASLDGVVVVYGAAVTEQDVRSGLANHGALASVSRDEKVDRWRARFQSHAEAERAAARDQSIVNGATRLQTLHVPRPYGARGWCCEETGVATEGVAQSAYFPKIKAILDRLPPKLVDIDGAAPEAAREQYGGSEGGAPRIERVRSSIRSAAFSSEADRATVVNLFDNYITLIGNAMARSGEGMAGEYVGERNAAGEREGRGKVVYANGDVYEGEYKAGKMEGRGIYRSASGDVYEGEFKADKKEGRGIYQYADGSVYEGEYKADEFEGRGIERSANGDVYEGEWKAGERKGRGIYRFANGHVYEGEFKAGKSEGRGISRYADGNVYEGEWKAGKKEGQCIYRYANGDVYEGEFKADKMEGRGIIRYANGNVYEGEWKAGKKEGRGIYRSASGDVYEGEHKAGNKEGRGKYVFANGDVYEGEYKAGNKEGRGIYQYANGAVYEGEFKAGEFEGRGIYWYADGAVYEGEHKAGEKEGQGMYLYADGRIKVGFYKAGINVGEGVRWMADGRSACQLQDGKVVKKEISPQEAKRCVERLGLPMPVRQKGKWVAGQRG